MSQLVRLEGKHSTQNAHCALFYQQAKTGWLLGPNSSNLLLWEGGSTTPLTSTPLTRSTTHPTPPSRRLPKTWPNWSRPTQTWARRPKNSSQNEVSARTGRSRQSWSSLKTICRSAASRHSCKRSSLRTDVLRTMARDHLEIRPRLGLDQDQGLEMGWSLQMIRTCWNITL